MKYEKPILLYIDDINSTSGDDYCRHGSQALVLCGSGALASDRPGYCKTGSSAINCGFGNSAETCRNGNGII